jgi:hypothetical protein
VEQSSPVNWEKKLPGWIEQPPTRVGGSLMHMDDRDYEAITNLGCRLCRSGDHKANGGLLVILLIKKFGMLFLIASNLQLAVLLAIASYFY